MGSARRWKRDGHGNARKSLFYLLGPPYNTSSKEADGGSEFKDMCLLLLIDSLVDTHLETMVDGSKRNPNREHFVTAA